MHEDFKIKGNRERIRSIKELDVIGKRAADEAFKTNKKMLDEYLIGNNFSKYRTNAYVRGNNIDTLEYIDLQKDSYGSKTFTVNYAIMPLYVPHEYIILGFGGRLGKLICKRDTWWDFADEKAAAISFKNVMAAIERFVLPWFSKYRDEEILKEELLNQKKWYETKGLGIPYKNKEWIDFMDRRNDMEEIIARNILKLRLPKRAMKKVK